MNETIHKIQQKASPKDFFLNLGVIFLLYFLAVNILILLFVTIDTAFPRSVAEGYYGIPDISFPLSALIIGFPLFLFFSRTLLSEESAEPEKRELSIHKWLTYLTLFVAGIVVIVDFIVLLSTFLRGEELAVGFVLKVLSIFVIAGITFGYYLSDLRYKGKLTIKKFFAYGAIAIIVFAIVWGFSVFGSPATQKAKKFDENRISHLQMIQNEVFNHWQIKKTIPENLDELNDAIRGVAIPRDPRTNGAYGYEKISATSFKLCAIFEKVAGKSDINRGVIPVSPYSSFREFWGHDAGLVCFERSIDPSRYPDMPTKIMLQ